MFVIAFLRQRRHVAYQLRQEVSKGILPRFNVVLNQWVKRSMERSDPSNRLGRKPLCGTYLSRIKTGCNRINQSFALAYARTAGRDINVSIICQQCLRRSSDGPGWRACVLPAGDGTFCGEGLRAWLRVTRFPSPQKDNWLVLVVQTARSPLLCSP